MKSMGDGPAATHAATDFFGVICARACVRGHEIRCKGTE